jgi:hypothetical protein
MATPKKESPLRSPLLNAFNNIVSINRSASQMRSTQTSYNDFLRFMSVEVKNIESIKIPDEKQVRKLANLNVAATFGSAGSLLSGLANGALDIGGFLGDFFGGKKGKGGAAKGAAQEAEKATGKALRKGSRIKIPGVRGLPIISTVLAGLDFAEGISEGESVGKAGAGALGSAAGAAGGALAGTALAGVIGQALVPIPGLGFVLGAGVGALGGMAGGYLADRAYESATGEGKVKDKTKEKLKQQEQKQKIQAASLTAVTFPQVLDKFDTVVTQFERTVANLDLGGTTTPEGYDEELTPDQAPEVPEGTTTPGADTVSYGTGNAEFGETGNVRNTAGWVHGHFQGDSESAVTKDTTMVVKALLKQGSPVYLNPGVDLKPGKEYSDAELTKYVDNARKSHTHSGTGKSVDVFVKSGTKVPVPLTDVGPTGKDFGGYGRGGLAGYIQGTRTWIGHLKPGSKGGLQEKKGDIKPKTQEGETEGLKPNTQVPNKTQAAVVSQTKPMSTAAAKPTQNLSQMSTDQLKGMLDPTKTGVSNPAAFKAAQEARTKGQESGLSGEALERSVMIASIRAKNAESQVEALSQQPVIPQQLQQYPDYNLPQSSVTIIPMMMGGSGGGSQQRPMVVSSGGGGGGTTIMPPVPEGHLLNSLFKTMLLTNLSGT